MKDYETGLTADWLRDHFEYDPETGRFKRLWPVITGRGSVRYLAGTLTGSMHKDGYIYMGINKRLYVEHRLAWLWMTGSWPKAEIDHIDGNRSNNRWDNLREATVQQNRMNSIGQRSRKNPYPGVYRAPCKKVAHIAQIKVDREVIYLGRFDTAEQAYEARKDAERKYFGEFAGHLRNEL